VKRGQLRPGVYEVWQQWSRVEHGHGAVQGLEAELERLGIEKALLVTTRSVVRERRVLDQVTEAAGGRVATVFGESDQHVPRDTVMRAASAARRVGADGFVSVGGGSVIDTAKGVALVIAEGIDDVAGMDEYRVRFEYPNTIIASPLKNAVAPHVAIPTTLSGGEYSGIIGISNPDTGTKDLYSDSRLSPDSIILDSRLTMATPSRLWAATGIKVIGDATEQLYSRSAHPVMEPLALRAIELLFDALPVSVDDPEDEDARLQCLLATWMTHFGWVASGSMGGIGAGLRHQVGALCGIPHGEATCALLPHVLRFNLPAAPHIQVELARSMGLDAVEAGETTCEEIAARVEELIRNLGLPQSLAELGVRESDFPTIAGNVLADFVTASNPRTVTESGELVGILAAAM